MNRLLIFFTLIIHGLCDKNILDGVDHIYIVHFAKNLDRKNYLDSWFQNNGIKEDYVTFASYTTSDTLTPEIINKYYNSNPDEGFRRSLATYDREALGNYQPLSKKEISITIDHILVMQDAAVKGYNNVLVLEDDVIFGRRFVEIFNERIKSIPSDLDAVFIGDDSKLHISRYGIPIIPEKFFYLNPKHHSRDTSSYMITSSAIKKVLSTIIPFSLSSPWEFNYQFVRHNLYIYWMEPAIVTQGSQIGLYQSGVRTTVRTTSGSADKLIE
jgi:GR25 family glycosyltransferase involved in LPS biosynthesis